MKSTDLSFWRSSWLCGLLLLVLTGIVYIPAMQGGYIWDDDFYLTQNVTLRSWEGLRQIWFEPEAEPQYYPLVFTSFWLEYHLWGLHPFGYHLVNVLLHAFNAILLWLLLRRLAVPGAWWAAAVFALHPVQVESVAWITERKNVLSGFFYFSAFLTYLQFALPAAAAGRQSWRRNLFFYLAACLLFLAALLSKTVTSTLPAALLLILWWKKERLSRHDLLPLLPLFALGLGFGLLTILLERHHVGALGPAWDLSWWQRFINAGRVLWFYAGKLAWPQPLAFIYPKWQTEEILWWLYLFPLAALAVPGCLWAFRQRLGKAPLAGVLFFMGTLFPALGFFNIYPMLFSYVADHFQYLASAGLIALVVGFCSGTRVEEKSPRLAALFSYRVLPGLPLGSGILAAYLLLLGSLTWQQGWLYRDADTLWADTLKKNPACFMAHNNLGASLHEQGRFHEAIIHYKEVVQLYPAYAEGWSNLGLAYEAIGEFEKAIFFYRKALRLKPDLSPTDLYLRRALEVRNY